MDKSEFSRIGRFGSHRWIPCLKATGSSGGVETFGILRLRLRMTAETGFLPPTLRDETAKDGAPGDCGLRRAVAVAFQDAQVCAPWTDGVAVLVGHDS